MSAADQKPLVKVPCSNCGGGKKNHKVHFKTERRWVNENAGIEGIDRYEIVECVGCETLRFRQTSWDSEGHEFEDYDEEHETVTVYPQEAQKPARAPRFYPGDPVPEQVLTIYHETIQAYNFGAPTLAGAGLRAIVEALCINQGVTGRNLQAKIDALVAKGLLAKPRRLMRFTRNGSSVTPRSTRSRRHRRLNSRTDSRL